MKPLRVGLLPCGSDKAEKACPAREMYLSTFFQQARYFAEKTCDDWLVITSKYGPCYPEQVIEPYDDYLGKKPRKQWKVWFDWIFPNPTLGMLLRKRKSPEQPVEIWSVLPVPFALYLHPALEAEGFKLDAPLTGLTLFKRTQAICRLVKGLQPSLF